MVRVLVQSRRTVRLGSWADVSLVIAGHQRVDVFFVAERCRMEYLHSHSPLKIGVLILIDNAAVLR